MLNPIKSLKDWAATQVTEFADSPTIYKYWEADKILDVGGSCSCCHRNWLVKPDTAFNALRQAVYEQGYSREMHVRKITDPTTYKQREYIALVKET
ncbi:MAG TPA: hypothetical protein VH593_08620 [Ktedonobacteraceae bacterium]|jgi:hypothetical protein